MLIPAPPGSFWAIPEIEPTVLVTLVLLAAVWIAALGVALLMAEDEED